MLRGTRIVALLLAMAAVLFTARDASADHYLYLGADPAKQVAAEPGPENRISEWWTLYTGSSVWWKADAAIRGDVAAAISHWTNKLPPLRWFEDQGAPDITFLWMNCDPADPNTVASFKVTDWHWDGARYANYWKKAEICIDADTSWGTDGRVSAIGHEIGHAYGLHERYYDQGPAACSSKDTTIMDGATGSLVVHCDGLPGAGSNDQARVEALFKNGEFAKFTATHLGAGVAQFQFEDAAWGEGKYNLSYLYWNGTQWVTYFEELGLTSLSGTHRDMGPNFNGPITRTHSPSFYGVPPGSTVIACGNPYFKQYATYGIWRCSNGVAVP